MKLSSRMQLLLKIEHSLERGTKIKISLALQIGPRILFFETLLFRLDLYMFDFHAINSSRYRIDLSDCWWYTSIFSLFNVLPY